MRFHGSRWSRFGILLLSASWVLVGCSRKMDVDFVASDAVKELPASHQEQIRTILAKHFGSPQKPRLVVFPTGDAAAEDAQKLVPFQSTDGQFQHENLAKGMDVYQRNCAACHGVTGDGAGVAAAYLNPKPRDYRRGTFKFTSTPFGTKPRRQDLIRTVVRGARGTSMPSFRWMPDDELQAVVDYVILLSFRGELEFLLLQEATTLDDTDVIEDEIVQESLQRITQNWNDAVTQVVFPISQQPIMSDETVALGKAAFLTKGCSKCHGTDGRGQTQDNVGKDIWGHTVKAADLTSGMLHGGHRPTDIYRRIYSGINGTPMPAFKDALSQEPDTVWHLVHFVRAVAAGRNIQDLPTPPGASPPPTDAPPTDAPPADAPPADAPPADAKSTPSDAPPADAKPAPSDTPPTKDATDSNDTSQEKAAGIGKHTLDLAVRVQPWKAGYR